MIKSAHKSMGCKVETDSGGSV